MRRNERRREKSSRWQLLLLGAVVLIPLALVVRYLFQEFKALPTTTQLAPVAPPLRLSGQQFLLNWQSFPGRRVTVEYCNVEVAETRYTCRVFDGSRESGRFLLDPTDIDPNSAAWASANCTSTTPTRACTARVSGVIRKGEDGRPVLEGAVIEP